MNQQNQEVDLSLIFNGFRNFTENIKTSIFRGIQFCIKNAVVLSVLIVSGFAIGKYLDSDKKSFSNEVIVIPNFESVDYLYSKINYLNSKIKERDTVYLKKVVGIEKPKNLKSINVKAIKDMFRLLDEENGKLGDKERLQNMDLVSLMAKEESTKKVLNDSMATKNYIYHKISFVTKKATNEKEMCQPILKYLNNSDYFKQVQEMNKKHMELTIAQNDVTLAQIDAILNGLGTNLKNKQGGNFIYNNESLELDKVLAKKIELIKTQGKNKVKLLNYEKTIKDISKNLNLKSDKPFNKWPLLFVFLFIGIKLFLSFYKKQSLKAKLAEN